MMIKMEKIRNEVRFLIGRLVYIFYLILNCYGLFRSMFSWKLFNKTKHDCSLHNSLQRQHVASSSALIQNSR